jgi:tetratricopeptide (TPR) repeat protein
MSYSIWYRKTSWTAQDRADFFKRLKRVRAKNRINYLQRQAYSLQETATVKNLTAAIGLFDLILSDFPDSVLKSSHLLAKARCLSSLGNLEEAEAAFRQSIEVMRSQPNVRTGADLAYGYFVVKNNLYWRFDEVLGVLDTVTRPDDLIFPSAQYTYCLVTAVILGRRGKLSEATPWAERAIKAAACTHSGLSRHANVGLVNDPDARLHDELLRICATEL